MCVSGRRGEGWSGVWHFFTFKLIISENCELKFDKILRKKRKKLTKVLKI